MNEMGYIRNGYQGDAGPVKSASALSRARLSLLFAGLVLSLLTLFVIVLAARLGEQFVDFARGHFHGDNGEYITAE